METPRIDNSLTSPRSNKPLSFNWLGSSEFGRIVPFHVQECLSTDKVITCKPIIEMQMLPLASPTFGQLDLYVHYFYVPYRLIWDDANDVFSKSGIGANATFPYWTKRDFYQAYMNTTESARRSLFKHWTSFGLPPFFTHTDCVPTTSDSSNDRLTTLPFRAYNKIWWDFYRDPEVLPDSNVELYLNTNSGHDDVAAANLKYYPKQRNIKDVWFANLFAQNGLQNGGSNAMLGREYVSPVINGSQSRADIRQLEALTRMAERLSLSGKRQIDRFFAMYGVKPNFQKMLLAEYVGGAKASVLISDITATATTNLNDVTPGGSVLGQKAGAGYCALSNLNIKYTATEPGILMGVLSIMPKIHFVQGISKKWYRNSLDDFFRKELSHVSQVAVAKSEVACQYSAKDVPVYPSYDTTKDKETFAFALPYYEYSFNHDVLAGDFMYYHTTDHDSPEVEQDLAYMQSMGLYVDFPQDRSFTPENLQVQAKPLNKIFYYLGGNVWEDVDDHFHININVDCVMNRPIDGAVPTLETDEEPHASRTPLPDSTVL